MDPVLVRLDPLRIQYWQDVGTLLIRSGSMNVPPPGGLMIS